MYVPYATTFDVTMIGAGAGWLPIARMGSLELFYMFINSFPFIVSGILERTRERWQNCIYLLLPRERRQPSVS